LNQLWGKSRRAAAGARILFQAGEYEGACARAYYAMFNAARALLVTRGVEPRSVKRHASVSRVFSDEFVRNGPFDEALGRALRKAAETRHTADYEDTTVGRARAEAVLESMEAFMAAVDAELARSDGDSKA
jgi:uncharacterized protein (UPF0332 family)